MRVIAASTPLRRSPAPDAPLETEALHGESVTVYDEEGEWAWAQLDLDQYVGYLPCMALGAPLSPTHRVAALRSHAYPGPSIKLPPRIALSLGARVTIVRQEGDFAVSEGGLHLWSRHLAEVGSHRARLRRGRRALSRNALSLGRPDVGGDRLFGPCPDRADRAGVAAPRDSDMMEAGFGEAHRHRRPGDAVCARRSRVLEGPCRHHARSDHAHSRQRLAHEGRQRTAGRARDRIAASGGGQVTSVRRLTPL